MDCRFWGEVLFALLALLGGAGLFGEVGAFDVVFGDGCEFVTAFVNVV